MSRPLRIAATVSALVVCAWFGLGAVESHDVSVATGVVSDTGQPSAVQLARADSALNGADFLNPDREVTILRGRVAIKRGESRLATELLGSVTRAEPENLEAWIWFTGANLGDPAAAHRGGARIAQLDPLDVQHDRR